MQKNQTTELLKKIYQNSRTGMEIADMLIEKTDSEELEKILEEIKEKYYSIASEADKSLLSFHELSPNSKLIDKINFWTVSHMTPIKKPADMARLCINGCTEGIIEITGCKNNSKNADENTLKLAEKLTKIERDNIFLLEKFL